MIYELRYYEVAPGKMQALNDRFANHTTKIFPRHGIKVIGFWTEMIGTSNELVYMLAFDDLGHREKAWASFQADQEWQRVRAESERDTGPLVTRIRNVILQPTAYSPMK